ncbi:MAG: signal peptidase I [Patescibacteria group bacterium]|nr:signal peptidase I [Patescibacteria group bacterium]
MQVNKSNYLVELAFELGKGVAIFLVIIIIIHFFVATIFVVDGASMETNFHNGQYILVDRISYLTGFPKRGDPVVLRFPGDPENKKYIKRVIALPGETIEIKNGSVYINSKKLNEFYLAKDIYTSPNLKKTLAKDEYFMMGDNRGNSSDSRIWGPCPRQDIIGKAYMILLPPANFSVIPPVEYYNQ